ncbi:hypothetical protein B566_EDAN003984 [Ephemera danica]|nr:hypothetical protein B566_EDAN003984 [Ephemera danica]
MASSGTKFVREVIKVMMESKSFDRVMGKVSVITAGQGQCVAEMKVEKEHQNSGGTLHGGLTATLVDSVSTCALMTHERAIPGVSVNINVSYLKAAKEGDVIVIDAKTLKAGRNLAFLEVCVKNKDTGDIIATGSHTKYIG